MKSNHKNNETISYQIRFSNPAFFSSIF